MALDQAREIRTGEELDWKTIEEYLRQQLPELDGAMNVMQFHGGHANLTYLLTFGTKELILRRPPFGKIAPGAHDMKREYKVLSKLYKFFTPAPRAYHLCEDENVIGSKFVVIERRNGIVVRTKIPEIFKKFENVEERLTTAMVKALADLHNVNVEKADLTKLGRPEGYIERQLSSGWKQRWDLVKTGNVPTMDKTFDILNKEIPIPQAVSIVHNDVKFDNCQFQPDNPDVVSSIFDWDMTTLGDPLSDLGMSLSYWPEERLKKFKDLPVMLKGNFPSKDFIINKYQEYSGFDVSNIKWYESLSYWKGAVIAQQLYKRYLDGDSTDKRMMKFGDSAKALAQISFEFAEESKDI